MGQRTFFALIESDAKIVFIVVVVVVAVAVVVFSTGCTAATI